ncbi:ShlB/FhaC/HecB family hemolysin secretion/activation protein [Moorena producens]|uniref:ShlB/FhaC/HecB family hemolysin secretion/activation protein n=1 Tax=Moorena producens TaxID=1155739 RepID=UPI003C76E9F0
MSIKIVIYKTSAFFIVASTLILLPSIASAQSSPPPGVNIPPNTPEIIDQTLPQPTPSPSPPIPAPASPILPEPTQKPPDLTFPTTETFFVKKIEVLGSTVLQDEITKLTQPLENRTLTFADLLQLRSDITELYIEKGYVTSGAFLPYQYIKDNIIVQIQVVEGELDKIELRGLDRLQPGYVRSRLELAASTPLNQKRLEEALQLLQLDPLISRVNAQLTAGSKPGFNIVQVQVQEAPAFYAGITSNNRQSPSVGSEQISVFIGHDNLFGFGDSLSGTYGITEGLNLYDISYSIPINRRNGDVSFRYDNTDSRIIEDDFRDIKIRSETETFSVTIRQPLYRKPSTEFALGLALDLRRSQTFILDDIPFSFSEGPENGESNVTVIRFFQDWVDRNATRVVAARSQFNLGIDAFDATVNNEAPDGRFLSWLGQFQWVQRLSSRNLFLLRLNTQLTSDSLLSIERFSVGGVDTVRGYRQNQLVADNGITASAEVRIPLTANTNTLQIAPFFDIGTAWNNGSTNPDPQTIASLGLGLISQPSNPWNLRLDYGIPLISVDDSGNTLQDNGLYFSLQYQAF